MASVSTDRIEDLLLVRIGGELDRAAVHDVDQAIGPAHVEHAVLIDFESCERVDQAGLSALARHHHETGGRLVFVVPEGSNALASLREAAREHRLHLVHSLEDGLRWARLISAFGWSARNELAL